MKLGVSFNAFSGLELLEPAINSISPHVEFINVVCQRTSNTHREKEGVLELVKDLYLCELIDAYAEFVPDQIQPKQNETNKRNLGLEICKAHKCTHFMTMDVDEFYLGDDIDYAKSLIMDVGFETTACQMQTYYKTPEYRVKPPEEYYVPLISKIDDRRFVKGMSWPVLADPSRKLTPNKFYAFKRNEIEMHHMSYVREDIRDKLFNSSSSVNYGSRLEEIAKHHDNWKYPELAYLGGSSKRLMNVERCENLFDILF